MARKTSPPTYRKQKRKGKADVAFAEIDGHRVYLGPYGSGESRERYRRLLAETEASGGHLSAPANEITVNEVLAAHWKHAETYYADSPRELEKIKTVTRIMTRLYGRARASEFGPRGFKTCRQFLVEAGNCRRQVNQQASRMRRVFKWAVENQHIPAGVLHGLQAVTGLRRGRTKARESEPVRPVPDEFVNAVQPYVGRQVWAMIELQRLTGARPGEITIMRGIDIDLIGTIWTYTPRRHKGQVHGHTRTVELGKRAQAVLDPFLTRTRDLSAYCFSPREATAERYAAAPTHRRPRQQPNQPRTTRTIGDCYTVASYRRAIQSACKKAKLPGAWHPHQLRHNFATRVRREYGIETARILLGHRSAVTSELYAEADQTKAREIVSKIG